MFFKLEKYFACLIIIMPYSQTPRKIDSSSHVVYVSFLLFASLHINRFADKIV